MAGRIGGPKIKNSGQWTQAKFNSFIRSQLRAASMRWGPIYRVLAKSKVSRGFYHCAACGEDVPLTTRVDGKRVKNVHVDHIDPIVDPAVGFVSWDKLIERMFVEEDGLQVLCGDCHTKKTNEEKAIAKLRRAGAYEEDIDD